MHYILECCRQVIPEELEQFRDDEPFEYTCEECGNCFILTPVDAPDDDAFVFDYVQITIDLPEV